MATFGAWSALGFYRGIRQHDFDQKREKVEREGPPATGGYYGNSGGPVLYSSRVRECGRRAMGGCMGMFIYMSPLTWLCVIPKELYRLEVNLRNIEGEKKAYYYHEIF